MPQGSTSQATKKPTARSRVSNGSKLLPGVDGRTKWARRLSDLIDLYAADMGDAVISNGKQSLIRRAAVLTVELERTEASFADQGVASPEALNSYQTTCNSLRRLLETLGVKEDTPAAARRAMEAAETRQLMEGYLNTRSLADYGVAFGTEEARRIAAKRVAAYAIAAKEDGASIPPELAALAVELSIAYAQAGDEPPQLPPINPEDEAVL